MIDPTESAAVEAELEETAVAEGGAADAPAGPFPRDVTGLGAVAPDEVREAMEDVFDPELGVNVVDLGLLYDVEVDDGHDVTLHMTLTSAACPLTDQIEGDTSEALENVAGVRSFAINWVWQPSWTPEMMSPAGKMQMQAMGFNL